MSGVEGVGLAGFNARPAEEARAALLGCCRAERWAAQVTIGAAVLFAGRAAGAGG